MSLNTIFCRYSFFIFACLSVSLVFGQAGNDPSWKLLDNPLPGAHYSKVDFIDDNTGFAIGFPGILIKTTDGGKTWSDKSFSGGRGITAMEFITAKTGFLAVDSSGIMKTEDAGDHWTKVLDPIPNTMVMNIQFLNEKTGFLFTNPNRIILKTKDGGKTWSHMILNANFKEFTDEPAFKLQHLYFLDEQKGYATANYGLAFKTIDGGKSWSTLRIRSLTAGVPFDQHPIITSMFFINEQYGYLSNHMGRLFRSTNSGETWERQESGISPSMENALRDVQFIDTTNGFAAGDHGVILQTTNGGNSWQRMPAPTENLINDMFVIRKDLIYAVGFRGTLLKYSR